MATESWGRDGAERFAAKQPSTQGLDPTDLVLYPEQYGSHAKFAVMCSPLPNVVLKTPVIMMTLIARNIPNDANELHDLQVMCPHTEYWQNTVADVVRVLNTELKTDGVYLDQIAAAGVRNCWDPTHNHTIGGGDHWVTGYGAMLGRARQASGPDKLLLTESNAEPFLGALNLFLTLVGFSNGELPSARPSTQVGVLERWVDREMVGGTYALFSPPGVFITR